jgi:dolichol-phosphate mannosyltransferase
MPVLVERLDGVLDGVAWQLIVVDDDSPDGTAGFGAVWNYVSTAAAVW